MSDKYINFKTDMADERVDTYKRVNNLTEIDGVKVESKNDEIVTTTTVDVLNENGATALSKEIGKYITMEIKDIKYLEEKDKNKIINTLSNEIKNLIGEDKTKSILVVGLGNIYVTPDSLGPKVVQSVDITRHLINFAKDLVEPDTRSVSALSPGVLGTTGIETSEIITSVCNEVKPDIVIAIDSLASSSINRLGTTIQLSNTGITPGAGVRNKREGINQNTLNVPVIAIGVPTVVDMATITSEAIDKMVEVTKQKIENGDNSVSKEQIERVINIFNDDNKYNMIANVLDTDNFIVTPKEIDDVIQIVSDLISSGINMSIN
ncbi:germination protease [Clostridium sp. CAG:465]|nr:germination protease [Clostridium sp. CAG:465]